MRSDDESLDPEDWDEFRRLGHRMLDDMIEYLSTVRQRPAWQPVPPAVRGRLASPLAVAPEPLERVYEEFKRDVLPYPTGNIHPRFWGWVMGTGSPTSMLADMLASGMNSWLGGFDHSAPLVEEQVLRWLAELLRFPSDATGVLTSGGTVANLIGLNVARNAKAGFDVRRHGLQGPAAGPPMLFYGSTETHSWAQKAVELLGLGDQSLRRVAVDAAFRVDVAALRSAIRADRSSGARPICVIANVGTVNTGAVDDLPALAALCREEELWLHVDGAFGALAALSPKWRHRVAGLELADSLAFDLHKWMYMPFGVGCVLVRDAAAHRAAFALTPSYLGPQGRGVAPGPPEFAARGIELARSFKALRVWFGLKVHGAAKFGRLIERDIEHAHHLASLVAREPLLELLAPVALNVVCLRFNPGGLGEERLNAINAELLVRIQESGLAVPSGTSIRGRFAIRVAVTNHRSRRQDFELFTEQVLTLGKGLCAEIGKD